MKKQNLTSFQLAPVLLSWLVLTAIGDLTAQTCTGDRTLSNQAEVDAFNCTTMIGDLTITGEDITNLDGLSELTSLKLQDGFADGGNLLIQHNPNLTNVDGLAALTNLERHLWIENNAKLTNIDGLAALTRVDGIVWIDNNPILASINGLSKVTRVGGNLWIAANPQLTNVDGLATLTASGTVQITNNASLANLDGLAQLTTVDVSVEIRNNPSLTNLDGLLALTDANGLVIDNNPGLTNVDGLANVTSTRLVEIVNNSGLTNVDGLAGLTSTLILRISNNAELSNLDGLANLTSLERELTITNNPSLTNLNALSALMMVGGDFTITDNENLSECCGIYTLINTPGAVTGSIIISGNATGCDSKARIDDVCNTPPTALCKPVTVIADADCRAIVLPAELDGGSSDPDGHALTFSASPEGPYPLGMTVVVLTVGDQWDNGTCSTSITVEDHSAPSVSCSGGTISFNGEASLAVAGTVTSSAEDACGLSGGPTFSTTVVTCQQVGQTIPVVVSYTDVGGNIGRCTTSVQVSGLPCDFVDTGGIGCGSQADYNAATGAFSLQTTNCNSGSPNQDQQGSISYRLCGNGALSFRVTGLSSQNAFAGIQLRGGPHSGAVKAEVVTNLYFTGRKSVRISANAAAWPQPFFFSGQPWLKLERTGNQVRIYGSANGQTWNIILAQNLALLNCVYLEMIAYGPGAVTATFDDVKVNGSPLQTGPLQTSPEGGGFPLEEAFLKPSTVGRLPSTVLEAPLPSPRRGETGLSMNVYPNPTSGQITVELPTDLPLDGATLEVLDAYGRQVLRETAPNYQQHLDLSRLPAGAYFVRLLTADGAYWRERVLVRR